MANLAMDNETRKRRELLPSGDHTENTILPYTVEEAKAFIDSCRAQNKKTVVVTGCFDLLHTAHVVFLKKARSAGDMLVVGIESDERVARFKGPLRPVNTEAERAEVLATLKCIDFVFVIRGSLDNELRDFYTRLHCFLRADFLAISEGDPNIDDRRLEIEGGGGELLVISRESDESTTALIKAIVGDLITVEEKRSPWAQDQDNSKGKSWNQMRFKFD